MTNPWLRGLFVVMLALFVAGCAGSGTKEPIEPSEPPEETKVVTPAQVTPPPEPAAFNQNGDPLYPGTNRPLPRTYYFGFDQAVINPDDLASLEVHATVLRNNRDKSIVIEGHCDERGTREYNLALGERRSDTLRSFLTSAGVSPRQIEMVSYGEERPEDPGHSEASWARNRRAIMIYR